MTDEMEGYKRVHLTEGGHFGVQIFVRRPPEVLERLEALDDTSVEGELTAKELAGCLFYGVGAQIYDMIQEQAAQLDPATKVRVQELKDSIRTSFKDAGFAVILMEEIPNEYWPRASSKVGSPWFLVSTTAGHFKVGWRKRVIVLDWSRTAIVDDSDKIFVGKDVTKFDKLIHCWGYPKLTEYLKILATQEIK